MDVKPRGELENAIRVATGLLIILAGMVSGGWLMWWLIAEGDIIDIIHRVKMALPGWAWLVMKYGLSIAFGAAYLLFFLLLGAFVIGRRKRK